MCQIKSEQYSHEKLNAYNFSRNYIRDMDGRMKACLHVPSTSPFFVSGIFDLFVVTQKQHP